MTRRASALAVSKVRNSVVRLSALVVDSLLINLISSLFTVALLNYSDNLGLRLRFATLLFSPSLTGSILLFAIGSLNCCVFSVGSRFCGCSGLIPTDNSQFCHLSSVPACRNQQIAKLLNTVRCPGSCRLESFYSTLELALIGFN